MAGDKGGHGGVAGERSRGPDWLGPFKQACHPATSLGLRRHLAADRGFFRLVCEWALRVGRHMARFGQEDVGAYSVSTSGAS